ncbi:hypothetical protein MOO44_08590 [Nicoliella spurrieriana]|uniref:Uncharacterized protein n=1 Tax=Nicoliella spurrieriana TaxID=2925830 RepID=A0A976RSE5_9LACO|nr:hypothetical protein [Nicoliella spurrieriana]UQS86905.1 hypothetical protein MOO44_08590 [Nicoliella spurrieriana]
MINTKKILFTLGAVSTFSFAGVASNVSNPDSNTVYAAKTNEFGQYPLNTPNIKLNTFKYQYGLTGDLNSYVNSNATPSTMPVFHREKSMQNANNKAYYRRDSKEMYIDGCPVGISSSGWISRGASTFDKYMPDKWIKLINTSKSFRYNHPELLLVGAQFQISKSPFCNKFVNIKKLYHDYYHVNIDKILSYTRPNNWETKYAKHGLNPKNYMVKGYTKDDLFKVLYNGYGGYSRKVDPKLKTLKHIIYKDQRTQSDHNDFNITATYKNS